MSGPVSTADAPVGGEGARPVPAAVELAPSRETEVGGQRVLRALPQRTRRTVGAWCFADHVAPGRAGADGEAGVRIGPHPHIGLQTVTWLVEGELLHRDSLGSEQPIRPGQLNLMTAGRGVAHAEEAPARGEVHGIQLWVAQPERTRHGDPAFEHHPELPQVELGAATATVLVGELGGATSPARRDTDHVGAELRLRPGRALVPLAAGAEHALVVLEGSVGADGVAVAPGQLAYLGPGRSELELAATAPARLLLLGGTPFESPVLMWWNFVARSTDEIDAAAEAWGAGDDRFGDVASALARIDAPGVPWRVQRGGRDG